MDAGRGPAGAALLVAAAKSWLDPGDLRARQPRVAELPFDSDRKRMTTVRRLPVRRCPRRLHGDSRGGAHAGAQRRRQGHAAAPAACRGARAGRVPAASAWSASCGCRG